MNMQRWAALDAIKTFGFLGAIFGHIFVWWYGVNLAPDAAFLYRIDMYKSLGFIYLSLVVLFIISAGAGFYFYLKKGRGLLAVLKKSAVFFALGILFGINTDPFIIFWNIFMCYATLLILFFFIYRYFSIRGVIIATISAHVLSPLLQMLLNSAMMSYIAKVFVGDPAGIVSTFPILPWFAMLGVGFITAYVYEKNQRIPKENRILGIGTIFLFGISLILPRLDYSNAFGLTAQFPFTYLTFFAVLWLLILILFQKYFKQRILSAYHPIGMIGRHMLGVYVFSVLIMLGVTEDMVQRVGNTHSGWIFLKLNSITAVVVYLVSFLLTKGELHFKKKQ